MLTSQQKKPKSPSNPTTASTQGWQMEPLQLGGSSQRAGGVKSMGGGEAGGGQGAGAGASPQVQMIMPPPSALPPQGLNGVRPPPPPPAPPVPGTIGGEGRYIPPAEPPVPGGLGGGMAVPAPGSLPERTGPFGENPGRGVPPQLLVLLQSLLKGG